MYNIFGALKYSGLFLFYNELHSFSVFFPCVTTWSLICGKIIFKKGNKMQLKECFREPVQKSERCHNWKGLQQSVDIYCRSLSKISVWIYCLHHILCCTVTGNLWHISQNVEEWEHSSNGLKESTNSRERTWAKEIEVKLFIFPSLLDYFWIMLNLCSHYTKWPFLQIWKEFFVRRLARGFHVVFHWWAAWLCWHTFFKRRWENCEFLWRPKNWNSIGYVDLLDFHESWH